MNKYFLTFGQAHPLRDNYIIIEASSYSNARKVAFEIFGSKWAAVYEESEFTEDAFPLEQAGRILKGL